MAIQYKPTKQKKEKPPKEPKVPKAPKAEKPVKIGSATKVKVGKKQKSPNTSLKEKFSSSKKPKAEKVKNITPAIKGEKLDTKGNVENQSLAQKLLKPKIIIPVVAALIVIASVLVLIFAIIIPTINSQDEAIEQIAITATPEKTSYLIGEEANYKGLRVTVTRKNGERFVVRASDCQISGFDSSKAGFYQIIVGYEGFETSFAIEVKEKPPYTPALSKISLETLPKTVYKVGETLDTDGGVILCEYVDSSVKRMPLRNSYIYADIDFNTPGEYELTVKYKEKGIACKTTYTITVTAE